MSTDYFKVTLIPGSFSDNPVKAIWMLWEQSRCDDSISVLESRYEFLTKHGHSNEALTVDKENVKSQAKSAGIELPVDGMRPADRFRLLVQMDVPIIEMIKFTFLLENIPVSFREHLVRHRIGSKIGPNSGVDDEPGIPDVTFWSQTSRVRDLQNFVDVGNYYTPEVLDSETKRCVKVQEESPDPNSRLTDKEVYEVALSYAQWGYRELRARGYKPEVARELLPSCTTHRIAWNVNLKSLKHIFGHRSCWIAMAGYWHPIIRGVIKELTTKVDPVFYSLANPPCVDKKSNCFKACIFEHENKHRMPGGNDPGVPCSLWLHNQGGGTKQWTPQVPPTDRVEFDNMTQEYSTFWGRDPFTGESLTKK